MKPVIFISAVSKELAPSRQLVANTLLLLGYEPVWQDVFGTEAGDLKKVLRNKINRSRGVIQLVGNAYGFEPKTPDPEFGPVSYTQYEALYARKRGLKVWYLQIEGSFPVTPYTPEPPEHIQRQAEYREKIKQYADLRHKAQTPVDLENTVLKLRNDLERLRGRFSAWMTTVTLALVIILGLSGWHLVTAEKERRAAEAARLEDRREFLEFKNLFVRDYERGLIPPRATGPTSPSAPNSSPAGLSDQQQLTLESRYPVWEKELGLPEGSLASRIPRYMKELTTSPEVDLIVRAQALIAQGQYAEAEKVALQARGAALGDTSKDLTKLVEALRTAGRAARELAGESHEKDSAAHYERAKTYFETAHSLTSAGKNFDQWVLVNCGIALIHAMRNQPAAALEALNAISASPSNRSTNASYSLVEVAQMLGRHGNGRQAAQVLEKARQLLPVPPESPVDLINHRYYIAQNLRAQGLRTQAAQELQYILDESRALATPAGDSLAIAAASFRTQILAETGSYLEVIPVAKLAIQLNNNADPTGDLALNATQHLALALHKLGRLAEAAPLFTQVEQRCREMLTHLQQQLGEDHLQTYNALINLASVLVAQSRRAEALPLLQQAHASRENTLGPNHASTLWALSELASCQLDHGAYTEAEKNSHTLLEARRHTLGELHPTTLYAEATLACVLHYAGRLREAEQAFSTLLDKRTQVLGTSHPETLWTRKGLGDSLYAQERYAEAEIHFRETFLQRRATMGIHAPATLEAYNSLDLTLGVLGKHTDAAALAESSLPDLKARQGDTHPDVMRVTFAYATALRKLGRHAEAAARFKETWQGWAQQPSPQHYQSLRSLAEYAYALKLSGKVEEAAPHLHDLSNQLKNLPRDESDVATDEMGLLAGTLFYAGYFSEAKTAFNIVYENRLKSLGETNENTLWALKAVADSQRELKHHAESESNYQKVFDIRQKLHGLNHPRTLIALVDLSSSMQWQNEFAAIVAKIVPEVDSLYAAGPPTNHWIYNTVFHVGLAYKNLNEPAKAALQFRRAWEGYRSLSDKRLNSAYQALAEYAQCLELAGNKPDSQALAKEVEAVADEFKPGLKPTPDDLSILSSLACALFYTGQPARAAELFSDVHRARVLTLGAAHPDTLWAYKGVGDSLTKQGQYADAVPLFEGIFEIRRQNGGWTSEPTFRALDDYSNVLDRLQRFADMESLHTPLVDELKKTPGISKTELAAVIHRLGYALQQQKKFKAAAVQFQSAWDTRKDLLGKEHALTLDTLEQLADCQSEAEQYAPAEKNYRELHRLSVLSRGAKDPHTMWLAGSWGGMLLQLKRYTESEEILEQNYRSQARILGPLDKDTLWTRDAWIYVLRQQNKDKEADKLEKTLPNKSDATGQ